MPVHHKIVAGLKKSVRKFRRSEVGGIIRKAAGLKTIQELERGPRSGSNGRTLKAKTEAARKSGVPKARVISPRSPRGTKMVRGTKDIVRGKSKGVWR